MGNLALSGAAAPELTTAASENEPTELGRPADPPFAYVEQARNGPRLIVGGVCVRWWNGAKHDAEAQDIADQINEDLARRMRRTTT